MKFSGTRSWGRNWFFPNRKLLWLDFFFFFSLFCFSPRMCLNEWRVSQGAMKKRWRRLRRSIYQLGVTLVELSWHVAAEAEGRAWGSPRKSVKVTHTGGGAAHRTTSTTLLHRFCTATTTTTTMSKKLPRRFTADGELVFGGSRWSSAALGLALLGLLAASCCWAEEASCHGAYDLYFVLDK